MILYHGTAEPFGDRLRGGGYDGVLWTARDPAIARMYIPEAGLTQLHHPSHDDERIRPDRWSASYALALALGFPEVEADHDDTGRARSWTPLTPRRTDLDDRLRALGYRLDKPVWLKIDRRDGIERIMPAAWRKSGRLFSLTFAEQLAILDHPGLEHDNTAPAYHDVDFFAAAARRGYDGVRIGDAVKDAEGEILQHEAIGLTPQGLARAKIAVGPATHLRIAEWRQKRAA